MTSRKRPSICVWVMFARVLLSTTHATPLTKTEDSYPDLHYSFANDGHDVVSGDINSQQGSRQGGVILSSYSLVEPDGSRRTVQYTADPHRGFQVVVHREANSHPVPERPAVHQVHLLSTATDIPLTGLSSTPAPTSTRLVPAVPLPAPGIRLAPSSVIRPVLQYIGVQPSYRIAGAPYYQLYQLLT